MSLLTIANSEFKEKLTIRYSLGKELDDRKMQTEVEISQFMFDFNSWHDYNLEFLKQVFNNKDNEYRREYAEAGLTYMGDIISRNQGNKFLMHKDYLQAKLDSLKRLENKSELLQSIATATNPKDNKVPKLIKDQVFIVHGHDDSIKIKVARFIEKLGFKPIILHEQANSGKTIIEKIEEYSNVGFGIVIYTPCDIGGKKTENPTLQNRARQNVVFEHGFLLGKIGRSNVCALVKDHVETPNDISGVVYVKFDEEDAWEIKIAKELRNSGYSVDMNKL